MDDGLELAASPIRFYAVALPRVVFHRQRVSKNE